MSIRLLILERIFLNDKSQFASVDHPSICHTRPNRAGVGNRCLIQRRHRIGRPEHDDLLTTNFIVDDTLLSQFGERVSHGFTVDLSATTRSVARKRVSRRPWNRKGRSSRRPWGLEGPVVDGVVPTVRIAAIGARETRVAGKDLPSGKAALNSSNAISCDGRNVSVTPARWPTRPSPRELLPPGFRDVVPHDEVAVAQVAGDAEAQDRSEDFTVEHDRRVA